MKIWARSVSSKFSAAYRRCRFTSTGSPMSLSRVTCHSHVVKSAEDAVVCTRCRPMRSRAAHGARRRPSRLLTRDHRSRPVKLSDGPAGLAATTVRRQLEARLPRPVTTPPSGPLRPGSRARFSASHDPGSRPILPRCPARHELVRGREPVMHVCEGGGPAPS